VGGKPEIITDVAKEPCIQATYLYQCEKRPKNKGLLALVAPYNPQRTTVCLKVGDRSLIDDATNSTKHSILYKLYKTSKYTL
jgi:hypothetical protein